MDDVEFQNMLGARTSLLPSQLVALNAAVRTQMAVVRAQATGAPAPPVLAAARPHRRRHTLAPSIAAVEAHFADAPECPHCRSTAVKRWGSANGLGRYRCKQCGVTFNALTGTPLARLHKRELWGCARPDPSLKASHCAKWRGASRRSDDGVPLAASLPESAQSLESQAP